MLRVRVLGGLLVWSGLWACGSPLPSSSPGGARPGDVPGGEAMQLVQAAAAYGNVRHEYLLDSSSALAPGRCVERERDGGYRLLPGQCAEALRGDGRDVSESTVDYHYIGVAIDDQMVDAEANLAPWASAGAGASERSVKLVAMAFVRERDPQFFGPGAELRVQGDGCDAGRANHFVGSVKMGAMLSYEVRVRSAELRGSALGLLRARLAAGDTRVTQRGAGKLRIEGLEGGEPNKPLRFEVEHAVPVAYAVYPLTDVCKFAFPAPELSPEQVDFGDVPSGSSQRRSVRVLNRAKFEVLAQLGEQRVRIPAESTGALELRAAPEVSHLGCRHQENEHELTVVPAQPGVQVSPAQHTLRVSERLRSGKAGFSRSEHIDTGTFARPDYTTASRQWECPADYELKSCRTEARECGESSCTANGYAVNAAPEGNGCKFTCNGPKGLIPGMSSYYCRFDAVMECALRCR